VLALGLFHQDPDMRFCKMFDRFKSLLSRENDIYRQAGEGRRTPHAVLASVLSIALILLAFGSIAVVLKFTVGRDNIDAFMDGTFGLFVPFAWLVVLLALWVRFYEKRSPASMGFRGRGALVKYLRGFALGLVMVSCVVGLMALAGGIEVDTEGTVPVGGAAAGGLLLVMLGFIIQGGAEEIVFRGWYMQVVGKRHYPWLGLLLSVILFGALHGPASAFPIIALLLYGLFLGLYYLREGSIWGVCGWHSAWNWSLGNVYGLTVSRKEPLQGVLFDFKAIGPTWLTGGEFGPEASLMTILVVLAAIPLLVLTVKRTIPERSQ